MVFKLERLPISNRLVNSDGRPLLPFKKPYDRAMGAIEDQFYTQEVFNSDLTVITDDLADANSLILQNIIDISTVQVDMLDTQGELQDAVDLLGVQQGYINDLNDFQADAILELADQQGQISLAFLDISAAVSDIALLQAFEIAAIVDIAAALADADAALTGVAGVAGDLIAITGDINASIGERGQQSVSFSGGVGSISCSSGLTGVADQCRVEARGAFVVWVTGASLNSISVQAVDLTGAALSGSHTVAYSLAEDSAFS